MFPVRPEGEGGPEPDIIGTAGEGQGRRQGRGWPHWRWNVVAVGAFALAGVITVASVSSSQRQAGAPHPNGVAGSPAQPEPPAPGAVPTQAWAASLNIANWPMPGSGTGVSGGMFAGGIAGSGVTGNRGWELTVRDVARPGQRCTAAVVLSLHGAITAAYPAYPVSPHPALRTVAGDLAFIALGAHSPGVGVALLQLDAPGTASADPDRTGGFAIDVPILPVTACGQRYYLGGFAYPLAGTLDLSVAGSSAGLVRYLVPTRLTRPKEPGAWHGTG